MRPRLIRRIHYERPCLQPLRFAELYPEGAVVRAAWPRRSGHRVHRGAASLSLSTWQLACSPLADARYTRELVSPSGAGEYDVSTHWSATMRLRTQRSASHQSTAAISRNISHLHERIRTPRSVWRPKPRVLGIFPQSLAACPMRIPHDAPRADPFGGVDGTLPRILAARGEGHRGDNVALRT